MKHATAMPSESRRLQAIWRSSDPDEKQPVPPGKPEPEPVKDPPRRPGQTPPEPVPIDDPRPPGPEKIMSPPPR